MKEEKVLKFILVCLFILLANILINIYYIKEFGNFRYIGLLGYFILGVFFNNNIIKF